QPLGPCPAAAERGGREWRHPFRFTQGGGGPGRRHGFRRAARGTDAGGKNERPRWDGVDMAGGGGADAQKCGDAAVGGATSAVQWQGSGWVAIERLERQVCLGSQRRRTGEPRKWRRSSYGGYFREFQAPRRVQLRTACEQRRVPARTLRSTNRG